ncbi:MULTISPECIES: 4Fe-4S single cluster domain-containing protein [Geobacillus]|uniref:4Fe-4S single cluster domain-containing protein n=1 Tax=Geobacillus TaxID=129337 RepID=UPI0007642AA0|nr:MULTISPECIES: 4Fe-4S single cluster domain-containing protein [Geobacillus]ASS87228.1 ribonucleoside-triphosphate reductase activating protein [Geobacillus lituanicus]MDF9298506.1 4Fe-4S single cluster domain-containing protein [Geobacillus stearothermophilus]STO13860.1 Pyruvate formate-lyase 1-activating enzyme [[Flavobacterium] thermophilum]
MKLTIHRFLPLTTVEGPGKRACLWVQGCSIRCKGCAVPWTWDKNKGEEKTVQELFIEIEKSKRENGIEGVTFLGGEPFDQALPLAKLASMVKEIGLTVMTFTGYLYEDIVSSNNKEQIELLKVTDLLIDGPFVKEKIDLSRPWIGSSNQRYHFLTSRYEHLRDQLSTIPNRIEVRLSPDGSISVNGMAMLDSLGEIFFDEEYEIKGKK